MSIYSQFEALESRRLLTAAVGHDLDFATLGKHGQLVVNGTSHNDSISITESGHSLKVHMDGHVESFNVKKVKSFDISAGKGDDTTTVGADVTLPGVLSGGAGDDTMQGGGGADTLNGDGGNDSITGSGDGDSINGGAGNDTITTGGDDDQCNGGTGDDTIEVPTLHGEQRGGHHHAGGNVAFSDLPLVVQTALTTDADGATITGVFQWNENGTVVYAARTNSTPPQFFEVDATGTNLPLGMGGHHDRPDNGGDDHNNGNDDGNDSMSGGNDSSDT